MTWKFFLSRLAIGVAISLILPLIVFLFPTECNDSSFGIANLCSTPTSAYIWLVEAIFLLFGLTMAVIGVVRRARPYVWLGVVAIVVYVVSVMAYGFTH